MSEPLIVKNADSYNLDTREQLEADVRGAVHGAYAYEDYIPEAMIIGWLDRQAAITEREVKERVDFSLITQTANALFPDYQERIAELTADAKRWADAANEQWLVAMEQADKVQELTVERDELRRAGDAMENGQFYAMYREACEELDEAVSFARRIENAVENAQDVTLFGIDYTPLDGCRDAELDEIDRLQRVVRIQAESFKALEREIADLKAAAQSDGQEHHSGIERGSDGLKTGDLRDAAYRHERLLRAIWRWLDIKQLTREPVTAADVDMWRERLEREGVKPE